MTDIIKPPDKTIVPHKGTKLFGGSKFEQRLKEVASQPEAKPTEMKNRLCLAVDVSGSMAGESLNILKDSAIAFVEESLSDEETAIALKTFPEGVTSPLQISDLQLKLTIYSLQARGGTPMHQCLSSLYVFVPEVTRVVLISDGVATDWRGGQGLEELRESKVLSHYIENKIPIDTIFASRDSQGEELLRNIATATGGIFIRFDEMKNLRKGLRLLSPRKRLLLTEGQIQIEGAKEVKL